MSLGARTLNISCFFLAVASLAFFVTNKRLQDDVLRLVSDAENLKVELEKIHHTCPNEVVSAFPRIPATHIVEHNEEELNGLEVELNVTFILLYNTVEKGARSCLKTQVGSVIRSFPKAKILCAVFGSNVKDLEEHRVKLVGPLKTEAEAINEAVKSVETVYFLLLRPDVVIEPKGSDGSIEWLHHALVYTPGFDIIGGSKLLKNREIVIHCYSINLCNWTLIQNYEYRRSFGEVMICDEVSHSFMAQAEIIKKFSSDLFDKNLQGYLYTDFFLRAKRLGLTTANRPEVMFVQTGSCIPRNLHQNELMDTALPFSKKHGIIHFKDAENTFQSICDCSDKNLCTVENIIEKWKFPKWYESGTFAYPFVIRQAIETLELIANQLRKGGVLFALRGETLFGAVMTKSVLPWGKLEAIHLWVFGTKAQITKFATTNKHEHETKGDTVTMSVRLPQFSTSMKVEVVVKSANKEEQFVNIHMNGNIYPVLQDPISELKNLYGDKYLEGEDSKAGKFSCKLDKHHACLPDMTSRGGSTYQENYCKI